MSYVTAAKPKIGGAISYGPVNVTLPTDAVTEPTGLSAVGYIADDGVTRTQELESENIKAWGGDVVLVLENGKTEKFKFKMLESQNVASLKLVNGEGNVTGTALATGISVRSNSQSKGSHAFVIDMIESGNTLHRIVIPNGIVTDIGDIVYVDNDAISYEVEITAIADSAGNTCYEYLQSVGSDLPPAIELGEHVVRIAVGETYDLHCTVIPAGTEVTWLSGDSTKATVSGGTVTGVAAGNCIVTASITVDSVTYSDTCTVIVTA